MNRKSRPEQIDEAATCATIVKQLRRFKNPGNAEGMKRFGIVSEREMIGVPAAETRSLARKYGPNHALAQELWATRIYDARILAAMIDEPLLITSNQMDCWAREFDNWAICDGCCLHLFVKTRHAWEKAALWCSRKPEFMKRAGFTMMAVLAVHDKEASDGKFKQLFPLLVSGAADERNGVKKGVNWALRQIGKRNLRLHGEALKLAERIRALGTPAARWIASDAIRELKSQAVIQRLDERSRRAKT